jgi:hypothetical protein
MSRFAIFACAALVVACAKKDNTAASDSSAAAAAAAPATPTISVADVAGTWTVRVLPETGDSTLMTYELMATADTTSWMMHLPDGQTVPMRILSVSGDSIVTQAGPYNSVMRKGVKVIADGVARLQDGKLVGTYVAHYSVTTADSVRRGRLEGTRKP